MIKSIDKYIEELELVRIGNSGVAEIKLNGLNYSIQNRIKDIKDKSSAKIRRIGYSIEDQKIALGLWTV